MSDYSIKIPLVPGAKITVVWKEFDPHWTSLDPTESLARAYYSHVLKPSRLLPGVSRFVFVICDGGIFDPRRRLRYSGILNLHDEGSTWARGWEDDGETEALAELRACRALADLADL